MVKALAAIAKELKLIRELLKRYVDNDEDFIAWNKGEEDVKEIADDELKHYVL